MQLKEWRIYLIGAELFPIDGKEHYDLTNEEFMSIAEENDGVRTLQGYANDFNSNEVSTEDFMRIIAVPVNDESYANAIDPKEIVRDNDYLETYFEVVREITQVLDSEDVNNDESENRIILEQRSKGIGRMYELAEEWTNEFQTIHKGREWDGEWFDTLEEFLRLKQLN